MDEVAPRFPWRAALRGSLGAGVVLLATALLIPPALSTLTPLELLAEQATLRLPPRLFALLLGKPAHGTGRFTHRVAVLPII